MNRRAAAIAGVIAGIATNVGIENPLAMLFGPETGFHEVGVRRMKSATADGTEHPDQTLREHTVQGRNKVVRLDAHVQEASNHVDDVVGVNSGEHEVAGQ